MNIFYEDDSAVTIYPFFSTVHFKALNLFEYRDNAGSLAEGNVAAAIFNKTELGVGLLTLIGFTAKLSDDLVNHCKAGCSKRMTTGNKSSGAVNGNLATDLCGTTCYEGTGLAFFAESDAFINKELGGCGGIVNLGNIYLLGRNASKLVG